MRSKASLTDYLVVLITFIFSVFIWYQTFLLPPTLYQSVGVELYPRIIATAVLIACVIMLVSFIRKKGTKSKNDEGEQSADEDGEKYPLVTILALIITTIYVFTSVYIGFYVSTFVYLMIMLTEINDFNWRKLGSTFIISLAITFVFYFVFNYVFKVYFPEGLLL